MVKKSTIEDAIDAGYDAFIAWLLAADDCLVFQGAHCYMCPIGQYLALTTDEALPRVDYDEAGALGRVPVRLPAEFREFVRWFDGMFGDELVTATELKEQLACQHSPTKPLA